MSSDHDNPSPDELISVQQALAALAPAPPRLDRDRLMFLAGVASVTPDPHFRVQGSGFRVQRAWLWPASSAALAATSLALVYALLARPVPPVQIVYRDRVVPTAAPIVALPTQQQQPLVATWPIAHSSAAIPADNYVRTRDVALRLGLDALGGGPGSGGQFTPAPTYRSLLESFLPVRDATPSPSSQSSQM